MTTAAIDWSFLEPHEMGTFDELVETGVVFSLDKETLSFKEHQISKEMSEEIVRLGYYGKLISQKNIDNLKSGIAWVQPPYGVMARLCDGPLEMWFDTIEQLKEYVEPRVEYVTGPKSFRTDFGSYEVVGATLGELGVKRD